MQWNKHVWSLFFLLVYLIPIPIRTEIATKTLNCSFSYTGFLEKNGVGCVLSNIITSSQRHNRTQRFRKQKHRRNDQSGPQRFVYNVMQIMQGSF